jgi:hypothetical protein
VGYEEILQSPYVLTRTVDQLVEDLQARRARGGISSYVIFELLWRPLLPSSPASPTGRDQSHRDWRRFEVVVPTRESA